MIILMNAYAITLIVQGSSEVFGSLSKKILSAIEAQTDLPLFTMPDLPSEQAAIQLEPRRTGLHLSCTVASDSAAEARQRLQAFSQSLEAELGQDPRHAFVSVADFVQPEPLTMQLDMVLQDAIRCYGVYHTGTVYALNGHEQLSELEDPFSLLFQAGGLDRLEAAEARQILNSRQIEPIWTRRGRRSRMPGEGWLQRHA